MTLVGESLKNNVIDKIEGVFMALKSHFWKSCLQVISSIPKSRSDCVKS